MSFPHPSLTLPDCGDNPPNGKRVLGISKQSTEVHVPMFICHVRGALARLGEEGQYKSMVGSSCDW